MYVLVVGSCYLHVLICIHPCMYVWMIEWMYECMSEWVYVNELLDECMIVVELYSYSMFDFNLWVRDIPTFITTILNSWEWSSLLFFDYNRNLSIPCNIGPYFIRSAKLPQIRAGVIIANVSWYMQYTGCYVFEYNRNLSIAGPAYFHNDHSSSDLW